MPRYDTYREDAAVLPLKAIVLGNSGTGKTGALAALANAGYRLFIADYDRGVDILAEYLTPEGAQRVFFKTFTDKMISDGLFTWPDGMPNAWSRSMTSIQRWKEGDESLGGINTWTHRDIVVIDSLTFMARAAMRYEMFMDMGRTQKSEKDKMMRWLHPYPRDYGGAQNRIEKFFDLLYGVDVNCHVIVCAHIRKLGGGGTQLVKDPETNTSYLREVDSEIDGVGYPVIVGKALSPHLARYFNTVVMTKVKGSGEGCKRYIHTVPTDNTPLKCEAPSKVKSMILIDGGKPNTGLAKLFSLLRGPLAEEK